MNIKFSNENLQKIMTDFYNVTGVRMAILDERFNHVCSMEKVPGFCLYIQSLTDNKKCIESDSKLLNECKGSRCEKMHICHAGLIDMAVPILNGDTPIGYIILGQMRRDVPFDSIKSNYDFGEMEIKTLKKHYEELYVYDDNLIKSISNLAAMIASYILTENMIKPEYNELLEKITEHIDKNISSDLSVKTITKKFGLSKNTLYRLFETEFGMPVGEYIKKKRIEKAKKLLKDRSLGISQVSDRVGMENYSYFAEVFKSMTGFTPTEYRKKE